MGSKKESTFANMVLTLLVVTLIASAALGYVYELTKKPIAASQLAKKIEAIKKVVPAFDNNPIEEMDSLGDLESYPAKMGDELVGVAIKTYTKKGFADIIWLMVGLDVKGNIINTSVLEHKETPGLGTKMADAEFKDQFMGINPADVILTVSKDGGDIDAITAATISSRAFCDAVQYAVDMYKKGGSDE